MAEWILELAKELAEIVHVKLGDLVHELGEAQRQHHFNSLTCYMVCVTDQTKLTKKSILYFLFHEFNINKNMNLKVLFLLFKMEEIEFYDKILIG